MRNVRKGVTVWVGVCVVGGNVNLGRLYRWGLARDAWTILKDFNCMPRGRLGVRILAELNQ